LGEVRYCVRTEQCVSKVQSKVLNKVHMASRVRLLQGTLAVTGGQAQHS